MPECRVCHCHYASQQLPRHPKLRHTQYCRDGVGANSLLQIGIELFRCQPAHARDDLGAPTRAQAGVDALVSHGPEQRDGARLCGPTAVLVLALRLAVASVERLGSPRQCLVKIGVVHKEERDLKTG